MFFHQFTLHRILLFLQSFFTKKFTNNQLCFFLANYRNFLSYIFFLNSKKIQFTLKVNFFIIRLFSKVFSEVHNFLQPKPTTLNGFHYSTYNHKYYEILFVIVIQPQNFLYPIKNSIYCLLSKAFFNSLCDLF